MDAAAGEMFVVERVAEAFPGLRVTGMAVCATFGVPRRGRSWEACCCKENGSTR
jgi:ribulose 1,5-bisphosphate synthetase/thiazole synthase